MQPPHKTLRLSVQTLVGLVGPSFVLVEVRVTADALVREVGVSQCASNTVERVTAAVIPCSESDLNVRHAGSLRERKRSYLAPYLQPVRRNRLFVINV